MMEKLRTQHLGNYKNREVSKMDRQTAYDIVNGIGGICCTQKEFDESLKILNDADANNREWFKFVEKLDWYNADGKILNINYQLV